MAKSNAGRKTKMSKETLQKLEQVFAMDGSDEEACFYADISPTTLYTYQLKHPEFLERKNALRNKPILAARQTVIKGLDDVDTAFKYLKCKKRDEFAEKTITEDTGVKDSLENIANEIKKIAERR